jgi:hypothetical protein
MIRLSFFFALLCIGFGKVAQAKEIDLYARFLQPDPTHCRILVNGDFISGKVERELDCPTGLLVNRGKYKLRLKLDKVGGQCRASLAATPELEPPEFHLPAYPDSKNVEKLLDCG